jgi:hypothetical protein
MNHDENKVTTQQDDVNENGSQNEQINEEPLSQHQSANKSTYSETPQSESTHDTDTEKTWHNKNAIKRGIAMLGYGFLAGFVRLGITLIAVFQFFSLLFSEKPNQPLVQFGQNLNTYQYQINQFLTVNSEMYPFPFADWPNSEPKA